MENITSRQNVSIAKQQILHILQGRLYGNLTPAVLLQKNGQTAFTGGWV